MTRVPFLAGRFAYKAKLCLRFLAVTLALPSKHWLGGDVGY